MKRDVEKREKDARPADCRRTNNDYFQRHCSCVVALRGAIFAGYIAYEIYGHLDNIGNISAGEREKERHRWRFSLAARSRDHYSRHVVNSFVARGKYGSRGRDDKRTRRWRRITYVKPTSYVDVFQHLLSFLPLSRDTDPTRSL